MILRNSMHVCARNQHPDYDAQQVKCRIYALDLSFDPGNKALDTPSIQRLLIEQVCEDGALIGGAPMNGSSNKEPWVWFEARKTGEQIFTPVIGLDDHAAHRYHEQQAIS